MLTVTNTHWLDDAAFAVLPGRYAMPDVRYANLLEPEALVELFLRHPPQGFARHFRSGSARLRNPISIC